MAKNDSRKESPDAGTVSPFEIAAPIPPTPAPNAVKRQTPVETVEETK